MSEIRVDTSNEGNSNENEQPEYTPIRPISEVGFNIRHSLKKKLTDKFRKSTRVKGHQNQELMR